MKNRKNSIVRLTKNSYTKRENVYILYVVSLKKGKNGNKKKDVGIGSGIRFRLKIRIDCPKIITFVQD